MKISQNYFFESFELSSLLKQGSPALFPTDTLIALASTPNYAYKLWDLKKRSKKKPLILMAALKEDLFRHVSANALEDAILVAKEYWPGALTMVLPTSGGFVESLNPGSSNIGMRIPDCNLTRDLLLNSGPLATTSANMSGELPSVTPEEASSQFPGIPLLSPFPWPTGLGVASTVIEWKSYRSWKVLRLGAVNPIAIMNQ